MTRISSHRPALLSRLVLLSSLVMLLNGPLALLVAQDEPSVAPAAAVEPRLYPWLDGKKVAFINGKGEAVVPAEYDGGRTPREGRAAVQKGKRWGYLDEDGKMTIEPAYDDCRDFHGGLAAVLIAPVLSIDANDADLLNMESDKSGWGYIDTQGKIVIEPKFLHAGDFSDGRAPVAQRVEVETRRVMSEVVPLVPGDAGYEPDPAVAARLPKILTTKVVKTEVVETRTEVRWGYIDRTGKWVIAPTFASARPFSEGIAVVELPEGGFAAIDATGKATMESCEKLSDFHHGLAAAYRLQQVASAESLADQMFSEAGEFVDDRASSLARGNAGAGGELDQTLGYSYLDATGKAAFKTSFERAHGFAEGLARVQITGKWGYINPRGELVIPATYEDAMDFSSGLAAVRTRGVWIYIRPDGERAIDRRFDAATSFHGALAWVMEFDEPMYINREGKTVWPKRD